MQSIVIFLAKCSIIENNKTINVSIRIRAHNLMKFDEIKHVKWSKMIVFYKKNEAKK